MHLTALMMPSTFIPIKAHLEETQYTLYLYISYMVCRKIAKDIQKKKEERRQQRLDKTMATITFCVT